MQNSIVEPVAKRILVLGGGGLWGAFEAGAWTVIEKHAAFDGVVGASAGALNACAIAGGMSGPALEQLWRESGQSARFRFHWPRYWLDGIADTTELDAQARMLLGSFVPRMETGVVVTQGWRLRPVLIREVTVETLLASCAVPFILPGRRVNGVLSIDGGLRSVCPVWAAREMGATEILAVNVWAHLPWARAGRTGVPCIEPERRLGSLLSSALWNPANIERWIEWGREAAERHFARQWKPNA